MSVTNCAKLQFVVADAAGVLVLMGGGVLVPVGDTAGSGVLVFMNNPGVALSSASTVCAAAVRLTSSP